jgi:hypothetical protein
MQQKAWQVWNDRLLASFMNALNESGKIFLGAFRDLLNRPPIEAVGEHLPPEMVIWRFLKPIRAKELGQLDLGIVTRRIASGDELMLSQCSDSNGIRGLCETYARQHLQNFRMLRREARLLNKLLLADVASAVLDPTCAVAPLVTLSLLALR